jgi:thiol-disulfide isomerase/thioredoxin
MLQFEPRQQGVEIARPESSEYSSCKVELVKGAKLANGRNASGWALKDAQGNLVRRFFDSDGDGQIDVWSYYQGGEECYREMDSNLDGKVDQYRWLGPNGTKWGVSLNQDGRISTWKQISAEEVSQEIFQAVRNQDFARLQALMITKTDLEALELPESEVAHIKTKMNDAGNKFQATASALIKLSDKTKWVHLEVGVPQCTAADTIGAKSDIIRHKHGTVLFSDGEKTDALQTGEMMLVGRAWRIIEGPTRGNSVATVTGPGGKAGIDIPEEIKELVLELQKIDAEMGPGAGADPAKAVRYNLARAAVLEKIVLALKNNPTRDDWMKQIADCYSTTAQHKDKGGYGRLKAWKDLLVKDAPGANITAYFVYREMSAEYSLMLDEVKNPDMAKLQEGWKAKLTKFVQDYATSEDAPDAWLQLGMVNEFIGKETEAKNCYANLPKHFPKNPMTPKAEGAIRRLNLEGNELELVSQTLGSKNPFDLSKVMRGKHVIVYYWASWNGQCAADFAKMKLLLATYASKGVELVCVNLDNAEGDAIKYLQNTPVPGTHLYQQGGLDSPPAVNYGIMVLPNLFLVAPDGKVIIRNGQVATLEDDLKKAIK